MATQSKKAKTSRAEQRELLKLSPFELKDKLIALAAEGERESDAQMLNAGRGNPNWISTTPREAFGTLLHFALDESRRRIKDIPDAGHMPEKSGSGQRFAQFLGANDKLPGTKLLRDAFDYGVKTLKFDADTFVHELTESIIGCMYPVPDRMLRCTRAHRARVPGAGAVRGKAARGPLRPVRRRGRHRGHVLHLRFADAQSPAAPGRHDRARRADLHPVLEIPHFDRYAFKVVNLDAGKERRADGSHTWQYADEEIDKLADKRIKAFFLVNPSNPPSYAMRESSVKRLVKLVKTKRPDLIIITDDVYSTFVPGFRSLMAELPQNTIGVYSYSKHFGCTGWRLGVVAIHQDNIFDKRLAKLPAKDRAALNRRYSSISLAPEKLKFIDRMVADSRQVALNHTAGLSTPQQIQMALFSLFALLDKADSYKTLCQLIVRRRYQALWDGLGFTPPPDADRAFYYAELDIMVWAERLYGAGVREVPPPELRMHRHPVPPGGEIGGGAAARRRLRRAGLVGAGVARQPAGGHLSEDRQVPHGGGGGLRRGVEGRRRRNQGATDHEQGVTSP